MEDFVSVPIRVYHLVKWSRSGKSEGEDYVDWVGDFGETDFPKKCYRVSGLGPIREVFLNDSTWYSTKLGEGAVAETNPQIHDKICDCFGQYTFCLNSGV